MKLSTLKGRAKLPVLIILVGVVILSALLWFKPHSNKTKQAVVAWPVKSQLIQRGNHAPTLLLYGTVDSTRHSHLTAAVSEQVKHVAVRDGRYVKKGQLLVQLNEQKFKNVIIQRQARVKHLSSKIQIQLLSDQTDQEILSHEKSILGLQKKDLARYKNLHGKNYVSASDLDRLSRMYAQASIAYTKRLHIVKSATYQLTMLEAQLSEAKAALSQAKIDLVRTKIKAPFNGVVTELMVVEGEQIQIGQPIINVLATDNLEVRALIPLNYTAKLKQALAEKHKVMAHMDVDGKQAVLELQLISAQVKPGYVGQEAIFKVISGGHLLVLGRRFDLRVLLPKLPNSFVLPLGALYNGNTVYVIINNRLQPAIVQVVGYVDLTGKAQSVIVMSSKLESKNRVLISKIPNATSGLLVAASQ